MARWRGILLLVCMLSVLLAACGSDDDDDDDAASNGAAASPAANTIRIVTNDNVFEPEAVTAPAGEPVTVTFVNEGDNVHEVEIEGLVDETMLQPGESKDFTFTPEKKEYRMYCEIHEDEGMEGTFTGE
ncbi:MAG TPA: cupredoxin domain-containing protein [Thermomicrobiales bacterium]|nr:cupredoxin domain-containing protein [Thermomicrobiales bacterium]